MLKSGQNIYYKLGQASYKNLGQALLRNDAALQIRVDITNQGNYYTLGAKPEPVDNKTGAIDIF